MFSIYNWSKEMTVSKRVLAQTIGVLFVFYNMWDAVSFV